jgi:ATP/ADP translocase
LLGQEKLDGLAINSIEREIVENIDLNEAIEEFAKKNRGKSRSKSHYLQFNLKYILESRYLSAILYRVSFYVILLIQKYN